MSRLGSSCVRLAWKTLSMLSTGKAAFTSLTIWVDSRKSYNSLGFRQVFQTKITEMAIAFVPQLNSILILQRICIKILSKAVQSI
jgi:hypothetical protein